MIDEPVSPAAPPPTASRAPRRTLRAPPPLMFVGAFLLGEGLQRIAPLWVVPPGMTPVSRALGVVLLSVGLLLAFCCIGLFVAARTTVIPHRRSSALVARGPYRVSRNPMYLSMTLAYLGLAAIRGALGPLLLAPLPVLLLDRFVIPGEEHRLRESFGHVYVDYCARVRRWL